MSERTRAKEALRVEVNTYTGENVRKIAATNATAQEDRILRVAAYCRVSTDDIDQLVSIELQKNNYRDMIKANPKWKYVGTYVDDGFSGTNTEHRPAFQLMMKDAMAGKIDMIITKSVSRFARNLLDCIGWVRKLKERDPPIQVFFEQEHLNTLDTTSNIILFVLAMVAEEESHMKSEAMLLSLEWRFSRGRFLIPALLGYDRVEIPDGFGGHRKVLRINDEEAMTVRLMYYMLLNGRSTQEIAETLTDLGRVTGLRKVTGKVSTHWTGSIVAVTEFDPYRAGMTSAMTEEMFFTSFVEGAQIPLQEAMDFLQRGTEPESIQEQMIWNNRHAWAEMIGMLYRPLDESFVRAMAFMLTEEMDNCAEDYRQTDQHAIAAMNNEPYPTHDYL